MGLLTTESYDLAENDALTRAPNRVIEAVLPGTFAIRGYPVRVTTDDALWRYVDVMHELGEKADYTEGLGGFTRDEFDLFKRISETVAEMTEARFGRRILPKGGLVRAFVAFRHIRFLSDPAETAVFEIGPGSGYLGALLALDGYRYAATEITQGFYLAQSALWHHLFGDRFVELATDPRDLKDFQSLDAGAVMHVPWWKYYVVDADDVRLSVDVVTANHTLCEMQPTAFRYALRLSIDALDSAPGLRYFFTEGPGADELRDRQQMYQEFLAAGYVPVFEELPIEVYTLAGPDDRLYEPVVPAAAESDDAESDDAASDEAASPPERRSRVEAGLIAGRQSLAAMERVSLQEVRAFQHDLMGSTDIRTDDEKFMRFSYGADRWW
jgi:hypothetical protein